MHSGKDPAQPKIKIHTNLSPHAEESCWKFKKKAMRYQVDNVRCKYNLKCFGSIKKKVLYLWQEILNKSRKYKQVKEVVGVRNIDLQV